jgi:hypothetical protein
MLEIASLIIHYLGWQAARGFGGLVVQKGRPISLNTCPEKGRHFAREQGPKAAGISSEKSEPKLQS